MNKTDIVNKALLLIGAELISSMDDDSTESILMTEMFDTCLDTLLEDHPWNFAKKRATLARVATDPEYGYDYAYQLPSDCLKVLSYEYEEEGYEYTIEDSKVLTDVDTCKITYIRRVTDMNDLTPSFTQAFIAFLASQTSPYLTNSAQYAQGAAQQYLMFLKKAKVLNARQNRKSIDSTGSWITARR